MFLKIPLLLQKYKTFLTVDEGIRYKKQESLQILRFTGFILGGRWDSNPRHSEPQSDALTN